MATTTYVVLRLQKDALGEGIYGYELIEETLEANNAENARRRAAERMDPDELDGGVTLIAVPARNWRTGRGTLKAETQRRIRPA